VPAWGEALVAVACLVGIVGTVVPVLPGDLLVGGAILVWALAERTTLSWVVAAATARRFSKVCVWTWKTSPSCVGGMATAPPEMQPKAEASSAVYTTGPIFRLLEALGIDIGSLLPAEIQAVVRKMKRLMQEARA